MIDENALLAANADFYAAFSTGDIEAMARVWADDDSISCIHPGWPAIIGRQTVLDSWRNILLGGTPPQIVCHEPRAIIVDDDGRVLCVELLGSVGLAASNHFRRINGVWKLVHHQASHIAVATDQTSNNRPSSRRVH
jgi:ketosteroid isomerase-like protein